MKNNSKENTIMQKMMKALEQQTLRDQELTQIKGGTIDLPPIIWGLVTTDPDLPSPE